MAVNRNRVLYIEKRVSVLTGTVRLLQHSIYLSQARHEDDRVTSLEAHLAQTKHRLCATLTQLRELQQDELAQ